MKKTLLSVVASLFLLGTTSAQVLPSAGVQNNLWTSFGTDVDGNTRFYGFVDTLQARVDIAQFSIEGMLNWGALSYWDDDTLDYFRFENTTFSPLLVHYFSEGENNLSVQEQIIGKATSNRVNLAPYSQESYYVNFLWKPIEFLDVGLGTKLNWKVGPAPDNGGELWESTAHIIQGGFSTDYNENSSGRHFTYNKPGSADVVGFVHYANVYAKKAIGVRFIHEGKDVDFQLGMAIPDNATTEAPVTNLGFQIAFGKFEISAAYEGLFQKDGNFYAGLCLGAEDFTIDAYFAWDSIDIDNDDDDPKDMSFGSGAAITFKFPKVGIVIRPEAGINWFEEIDHTIAWYVGGLFDWNIADTMKLSVWSSFAVGSADMNWKDEDISEDWTGGTVFNIRPMFEFELTKNHAIAAFFNFENRIAFNGNSRNCWSAGAFWTYKLLK